ncbi:MAG TPA: phosphate ABC transporter, permease protein PstA, partial [Marmoricola sp.]|nr:phosphate ABC transporter, permease protein PstA [Marmoricola sp.]
MSTATTISFILGLATLLAGLSIAWLWVARGRRVAVDHLVTILVWAALLVALAPLASLLWNVIVQGAPEINGRFLSWSMRNVVGEKGGITHAIQGTVLITLAATAISVPIGLLTAIYLVEY